MKYIDEFRDRDLCLRLIKKMESILGDSEVTIMEVCGTHTMIIFRSGIRSLLPKSIRLLSGPGCPVCVTPAAYLDQAIALSEIEDVIIATFGDMMRVPGSGSSLETQRAAGKKIAVVYSPLDDLNIARNNPDKKVVFLAVGFETTSPSVAVTAIEAKKMGISNLYLLSAHKRIPPALRLLAEDRDLNVDGFILPGHVSTIIGVNPYLFLAEGYGIPSVICGFEPLDILQGICMILYQRKEKRAAVEVQYKRAVKNDGNPGAMALLNKVFIETDSEWRGLGAIANSGYAMGEEYKELDAREVFSLKERPSVENEGCICGEILKGRKVPNQCPHFGENCTPYSPLGPCMVSSEGTCAAYYKYA
ncbi:MAG: hydrogenase formation protein HypD [Desulfobacterales bacterium]|nr:hydrogenase formation protein HypD [Desulfobacterales bacterium]